MYYVIQENLFKEYNYSNLVQYLRRHDLKYENIAWRPFVEEIDVKTERQDVWFFGSVSTGMRLRYKRWNPGIIYDENKFNFEMYLTGYGSNLLNWDGRIQDFDYISNWDREEYFIRPTHDTKTFESNLYTRGQWNTYIKETIDNKTMGDVRRETKVFYCTPKPDIQQEIRCWVIDGKVVTCSQYRIGKRIAMLNMDNNEEVFIFVKDMCKLYQPARAFVMDVCLYKDEYKIVELGCIHHCGFYDADMSKLIQSLENTFGHG